MHITSIYRLRRTDLLLSRGERDCSASLGLLQPDVGIVNQGAEGAVGEFFLSFLAMVDFIEGYEMQYGIRWRSH